MVDLKNELSLVFIERNYVNSVSFALVTVGHKTNADSYSFSPQERERPLCGIQNCSFSVSGISYATPSPEDSRGA